MIATVLATQLAEAVAKDEMPEHDGCDVSAGLFGPHASDWLRSVASELSAARAERAEQRTQPGYVPESNEYGGTEFGYTLAGIAVSDEGKRLMAMLIHAFGNDHPAVDDLVKLLFASAPPAPQAEQREPLTEAWIDETWQRIKREDDSWQPFPHVVFARAIEAAHGIGAPKTEDGQ